MLEGLTNPARRVVELAGSEARSMGHWYVGPEHLLLGLLDGTGVTAVALCSAGLEASVVRSAIEWIVGTGRPAPG